MRKDDKYRRGSTFIGILCFFWIFIEGDFLLWIPVTLFKSGGEGIACVLFAFLIAWGMKKIAYKILSHKLLSKITTTFFVFYMVVAKILASLLYAYTGKLNFQDVLIIYLPNMIILLCGITVIYELWNNWNTKKST